MSSIFNSYSIAVSGMRVNQTALTVTSHNVSNASTTGFSRQQIALEDQYTVLPGGTSYGSGTSVADISRVRNQFLDQSFRRQNAKTAYWETKDANLENIQATLNEFSSDDGTSDNGLMATIQEFFNSWEELSKDSSSLSARQTVLADGKALVEIVTGIDDQLLQMQADAGQTVKDIVSQLNDLATQVASLNSEIVKAEAGGVEASDYWDQRDSLVDQIAAFADITVQEQSNGMMIINIGGIPLVKGYTTNTLEVSGNGSTQSPLQVQWSELGCNLTVTGGSLKANLEDADQSGIEAISATDLPYDFTASSGSSISNLRQALNVMITTIALKVNELHSAGQGLDGSTGLDFFVVTDATQPLSLSNITVNSELEDVNLIAASGGTDDGDNTVASAIGELLSDEDFQYEGLSMTGSSFYQSVISWLAMAGDNADTSYKNQNTLLQQIENQRQSISGVSLDEETAKMIIYQNAYSASARVLSVVDNLLEGLINEIG